MYPYNSRARWERATRLGPVEGQVKGEHILSFEAPMELKLSAVAECVERVLPLTEDQDLYEQSFSLAIAAVHGKKLARSELVILLELPPGGCSFDGIPAECVVKAFVSAVVLWQLGNAEDVVLPRLVESLALATSHVPDVPSLLRRRIPWPVLAPLIGMCPDCELSGDVVGQEVVCSRCGKNWPVWTPEML